MIADPDVHNEDVYAYTHDTIRPLSYYGGEKKSTWVLSVPVWCTKGTPRFKMLRNVEAQKGSVEFNALWARPRRPTISLTSLKQRATGMCYRAFGFEFDDDAPKDTARTEHTT